MKLSTLCVLLGLGLALPHLYGLFKPAEFGAAWRKFPRNETWGWVLMSLGTAWFLWNVKRENITDFAAYKPLMYVGFGLVGLGTCLFVKDYLAVRGLAILLLLMAKVMLDTARWVDTEWRLVIVVWAYVWICAGIWFTISPWRLRDLIHWKTATPRRVRVCSALRIALGLLVAILGMTTIRAAEQGKPTSAIGTPLNSTRNPSVHRGFAVRWAPATFHVPPGGLLASESVLPRAL